MNVSFIIKSHVRDDEASLIGGSSKNPYRLIKYLSKKVSVPTVIYFDGDHDGKEAYRAVGFKVGLLKLYPKTIFQNVVSSASIWKAFRMSDVVQCHHPHYGLVAAVLRHFIFRRVKFVVKAHGTALPELRANKYSGLKGFILSVNATLHLWHDRFVLSRADAVLCSSEFQRQEMISIYGIPSALIHSIYNGYDSDYLPNAVTGPSSDRRAAKRFVFCGRVVPKKGIGYATKLFREIAGGDDSYRCILVLGKKREIEDGAVYREVERIAHQDTRIQIKHDLTESELYREFGGASIGLVTSENYESLPTVVVEMLAAGLPVFATYSWGVPEILPPEFGLSGNLHEDVKKIRHYLSLKVDSSRSVVARIQNQFGYSTLVEDYLALYRELMVDC